MKCNHKDKSGNSLIVDSVCQRCKTKFGAEFLKKQRDKNKRRKSKNN